MRPMQAGGVGLAKPFDLAQLHKCCRGKKDGRHSDLELVEREEPLYLSLLLLLIVLYTISKFDLVQGRS
jgi:hypothetical protein